MVNGVGFCHAAANEWPTAACEGCRAAAFVLDTLDAQTAPRTRPTVVVLDHARLRHAAAFRARLAAGQNQRRHTFYRPTHSPHRHKIETRGRKIKRERRRPESYATGNTLQTAGGRLLHRVGQPYTR